MFVKPGTRPATDDDGTPIQGEPPVQLQVRNPNSPRQFVRPEGQEIQATNELHRAIRDGDLVECERPPAAPTDEQGDKH